MNRTDRLHALAEELRRAGSRGRTTTRLAAWLEVSTRTIKRDVAALQQAGLPLWAQAGPGGGYVLDPIASLPPVNLTPAQAVAVAVALAAHRDGPYAVDGRAALEKILDVMDPAARDRAERLGGRVWVRTEPSCPNAFTAVIEQALAEQRIVALTYRDGKGKPSRRRVEPHLIAHTRPLVPGRLVPPAGGPTVVPVGPDPSRASHYGHRSRPRPRHLRHPPANAHPVRPQRMGPPGQPSPRGTVLRRVG